jgi:hypothetical protein
MSDTGCTTVINAGYVDRTSSMAGSSTLVSNRRSNCIVDFSSVHVRSYSSASTGGFGGAPPQPFG